MPTQAIAGFRWTSLPPPDHESRRPTHTLVSTDHQDDTSDQSGFGRGAVDAGRFAGRCGQREIGIETE